MPRRTRHVLTLFAGDLALVIASLLAARALRLALPWGKALDAAGAALPWAMLPLGVLIWAGALTIAGAYALQRLTDAVDEGQAVLIGIALATMAWAGALYLGHRELSRLLYLYFVVLDAAATLGWRALARRWRRRQAASPESARASLDMPAIGPIERIIKRGIDLAVAVVGLIVCAPLLGGLALVIVVSSPGPALYRSRRIGEGGRPFTMLKLRTMRIDAASREEELLAEAENGQLLFIKQRGDPRVTSVGRWLRRTSLDELPQLINILRGEMSLVGPRPELPSLVVRYTPRERQRLTVPQGMTGWWQVSGRSERNSLQRIEDDLYYLQHYSLLLDAHILWRTLGAVIRGRGAY